MKFHQTFGASVFISRFSSLFITATRAIAVLIHLLHHRIARQGFVSGLGVINNRPRVVATDDDTQRFLLDTPHEPRCMDVFIGNLGQFRHIAADEFALGIEFFGLRDWVENPEIGLRVAAAR